MKCYDYQIKSQPHLDTLIHHVIPLHPEHKVGHGKQERVHLGVLLLAQKSFKKIAI